MTRRRRARKPCAFSGKTRYRDEQAAKRFGMVVIARQWSSEVGRHRPLTELWVYCCPSCADWHLTSKPQADEHRVPLPERPAKFGGW